MTTYNTGNPIGSTDSRDRLDNSENFDIALNTHDATWVDRLGVTRDSFEGALSKLSFYRVGTFAAGYTLTNMRQTLEYNGHEYSWTGTFPKVVAAGATPETSGGIGAGAWVDRTDVTLRDEITPSVTEALRRSYAEAGYNLVDGSFEAGGTLVNANDVLLHEASGRAYSWSGSYPTGGYDVTPGTNPVGDTNWKPATDYAMKPSPYSRAGSFLAGGTATSKVSALLHSDNMYYTPKTGAITVPPSSAPDSNWVCVGLLSHYESGDLRNFKGVGNGVAIDTQSLNLAVIYANFSKERAWVPGGYTFLCDKLQFSEVSNFTIAGAGCIKMIGGRTGSFFYADGAQLTFINAYNINIIGIEFDGNRAGSPAYTGFNHGVQFVTGTGDYRTNNGGETKANRNIYISRCRFHDQGGFNPAIDKFGDGIYLFGCDGVVVENCEFVDIGRWGVAASDTFNLRINNNYFNCSKAGTVALGFVDIENESTDNTNGSYSRNISISNNTAYGYCQILVGAGSGSENKNGTNHYLRGVSVTGNTLTVEGGAHADAAYLTNLMFMGLAPFCYGVPTVGVVENIGIVFANNTLINKIAALSVGAGVHLQGIGQNNIVKDVVFIGNTITGFNKGILVRGDIVSTGYSMRNLNISGNVIDCESQASSIGIRAASTQLVGFKINGNTIKGTQTRAISIEDGRDIGAIDSYGEVSNNQMSAAGGVNMFAYVYRAALIGNTVGGSSATAIDATITNIDKDYGNTWNSLQRTIPAISVGNGSTVQFIVDTGAHTRFGYTVSGAAPFSMDNGIVTAMMVSAGLANLVVANLTGYTISKASETWTITVDKR